MEKGFTNKEVLIEIKNDLKDFRDTYDIDKEDRNKELAKRPTRVELWSLIGGASLIVGMTITLTGG